jgi:formylglycine-generating enzyme required for sulfatase activity
MKATVRELRTALLFAVALAAAACGRNEPAATTLDAAAAAATTSTATPTTTTTTTTVPATTTTNPATTTTADPNLVAGSERVDDHGLVQVWVPAGTFQMGTSDVEGLDPPSWATQELRSEQPQHQVTLTAGYWIDEYEVTNAAWDAFVADGGYATQALRSDEGWAWLSRRQDPGPVECATPDADHPRACITWYEAEAFAAWRGGRLPTEAQWEYAARGPQSVIYPWGDAWDPPLPTSKTPTNRHRWAPSRAAQVGSEPSTCRAR